MLGEAVEEDGGEAGGARSEDVGGEVVAYHDGGGGVGLADFESVVEEGGRWLVCPGILAEDDGGEIIVEATGAQFLVLHLVEAVAAHVHAITTGTEVVHQVLCAIDKARLIGAEVKEDITHLTTILLGGLAALAEAQRATETFYDEVVARYLAAGVTRPEVDIGKPVLGVEDIGVRKPTAKLHLLKQLAQSDICVAVRVVERIVKV